MTIISIVLHELGMKYIGVYEVRLCKPLLDLGVGLTIAFVSGIWTCPKNMFMSWV